MMDQDLIRARELKPPEGLDFWVFAEARPALLKGYHRAFCIASTHYRGSVECPGLVLGLDRGGACRGRAYRVAAAHALPVARYLHEREMVTGVYEPRWVRVVTRD